MLLQLILMHNKEKRKKIRAITECSRTKVLFCVCGQGNRIVVDCKSGTQWRQNRKYVRHSGDKNYPLSTKSTELSKFKFGDNVDRNTVDKVERAGDSRLSTNRRQIGNKVDSVLCCRFVAGFGDCRLCRHCVLGLMTAYRRVDIQHQTSPSG